MLITEIEKKNSYFMISAADLEAYSISIINKVLNERYAEEEKDNHLKPDEAAHMLGCSISTLWRWDKAQITHPIKIGNKVFYSERELRKLLKGEKAEKR